MYMENAIIIVSIDVIASDDHHSVDNDVKKKQKLYFPGMLCEFLKKYTEEGFLIKS